MTDPKTGWKRIGCDVPNEIVDLIEQASDKSLSEFLRHAIIQALPAHAQEAAKAALHGRKSNRSAASSGRLHGPTVADVDPDVKAAIIRAATAATPTPINYQAIKYRLPYKTVEAIYREAQCRP